MTFFEEVGRVNNPVSKLKSCALAVNLVLSELSNYKPKYCAAGLALSLSMAVNAQQTVNIPTQSLADALKLVTEQTGIEVIYNANLIANIDSNSVKGVFEEAQLFAQLLSNKGLIAIEQSNNSYIIKKPTRQKIAGTLAITQVGNKSRFGDAPKELGGLKADYQTTATKMALPIKETPQAISVVTRDALDARQVKNLAGAIELTAGVNRTPTQIGGSRGAPGAFAGKGMFDTYFMLRGQPVVIRSDGFQVGSSDVDLAAYERVEVVKGPAGFYGQGSLGGFINMVRKKPEVEFSSDLSLEVGSFDTKRADLDMTGALSENENVTGRLNLAYEDSGSFVDELKNDRILVAPSIEAVIGENTRMLAQLLYQKDEFDANPGIPLELVDDKLKQWDTFSSPTDLYGLTGEKSEVEIEELMVTVEHQLADQWMASLHLQTNKSTRNIIEGNAASTYYYGSGYGTYLYAYGTRDDWERDFWAGELRVQGSFDAYGQEHKVLFGAEYNNKERNREYGDITLGGIAIDEFDGDFNSFGVATRDDISPQIINNSQTDNSAIFGQVVLSLQEETKLLVSGRYDATSTKLDFSQDGEFFEGEKDDDNAFTTRLGLTHGFNDNVSAYAVYAESFEPAEAVGKDSVTGLQYNLDPIEGEGFELGLKTEWFDSKLGATLAIYQQDLNNRPIDDPEDDDFSISSGPHRTEGIEFEISGSPYQGLTFSASASWQDNAFLEKNEEDDPFIGLSINNSVDQQFSLYVNYEFQKDAFEGLSLGASIINVGQRQLIDDSEDEYRQIYIDGYTRTDIHLKYDAIPNWDMSLLLRNVTDESYIESVVAPSYGNYRGAPFSALLQVSYHFD